MVGRLTAFISSTVRDFGPVRTDLKQWLQQRGIEVRESADPEFPVEPSVHSLDACLRALEGCHVMILLIGRRYGNDHLKTSQSITWREYDEAQRLGIPVIKLILREVNDEATRYATAQRLRQPFTVAAGVDKRVFAFIEAIRKGRRDNWVHLDWDGSWCEARRRIDARLNSMFVTYQGRHRKLGIDSELRLLDAAVRKHIDEFVASVLAFQASWNAEKCRTAIDLLLALLARNRRTLFGFEENDRYNIAVYARHGDVLNVVARSTDPRITRHDRAWRVGEGHVGMAAKTCVTAVTPNLVHTGTWRAGYRTDSRNYVSAIAVPGGGRADPFGAQGVLIITSDRPDQFRDDDQIEVLTAQSVALKLSTLGAFELPAHRRRVRRSATRRVGKRQAA